jgi:DNA-3-methyladenine glycosylase I
MSSISVVDDDRLVRCPWGSSPPEYRRYHDEEWGRPVGDDRRIYEKLCLEGFQSGLSWLTILRKREGFRRAFAGFDPEEVAAYGADDVERLLTDASIVRHRAKIQAAIGNARATLRLREEGASLAALVWSHEPPARPSPPEPGSLAVTTAESKALSAELRRRGFGFVGPTTVYSAMQSLGVVDDHVAECHVRPTVESERARFKPPI